MVRPVCIIIRDGWGMSDKIEGNAVFAAHTPNIDGYKKRYPWSVLDCSGEAVGLPEGYQGSSEVGHLNMGAGRIVIQELKRIDDSLSSGMLFESEKWKTFVTEWRKKRSSLHLLGLLQDEGVHAHQEHLFKIMRRARREYPEGRIIIHPFLDGRDTPPRSTLEYIATLNTVIAEIGCCAIGTVMGRYYAMDRSRNWDLTDRAYNCIVAGDGRHDPDAATAVERSYRDDKTPDGVAMFDEYIFPSVIGDYMGVSDGDCVMHTNYRQDRAIQLTRAFVDPEYPGKIEKKRSVTYLGFTKYYDEFNDFLLGAMGAEGGMEHLLGEVVSKSGMRQLRIAETQKFRHVTSFFNGKSTTPYSGEEQVDVPSRFDPATFASHPEMEAYNVTDTLLKKLENNPYALIVVNYANGDMVGHTGDMKAATKAIEVVDECIGMLMKRLLEIDAHVIITADHGNAEEMIDRKTHGIKTSHTLNPVECIYVSRNAEGVKLVPHGKLADIAPTVLYLLDLDIPPEMTAENLIETYV